MRCQMHEIASHAMQQHNFFQQNILWAEIQYHSGSSIHDKMRISVIKTDLRSHCARVFFFLLCIIRAISIFRPFVCIGSKKLKVCPKRRGMNTSASSAQSWWGHGRRMQGEKQTLRPYHNEAESTSFRASAGCCFWQTHPDAALRLS